MQTRDCEVRVIYAHTDAMGIVYNANYIDWFEKGRTEWLRQVGYPYKKMLEKGLWLPVSHIEIDYKHPARYDDLLTIKTRLKKLKAATAIMGYEIVNAETGETCVTGFSVHPVTDTNLKPVRLRRDYPELYALLKSEEG
ncbi:MAG: acyl-CoA thioesterase [Anaerovoracaceae bacterium]|jgi:acyl-CoA thioester hydrolase